MSKIDLTGLRFGRLKVISEYGLSKQQNTTWLCLCDCGNIKIANSSYLITKTTMSCGCLRREKSIKRFTTHGKSKTRLYNIWASMKQRCYDKNSDSYNSYGRKGIIVCDDWKKYQGFESWALENGYNNHLTIDRINVYGNYFPENCQWISFYENRKKHRNSIMLNYDGRIEPLKTWCDILGLPTQTVRRYYHKNGTHKTELGIASVIETNNRRYFNISKAKSEMQNRIN